MVHKPQSLSFEAAATTPTVYVTVLTAFSNGTELPPRSRILVHAGTGGVGLAAISVATGLGCHVVATAGSAIKRSYLRIQGITDTADSWSTLFTEPLLSSGGPVDAVLNSLTSPGELMQGDLASQGLNLRATSVLISS